MSIFETSTLGENCCLGHKRALTLKKNGQFQSESALVDAFSRTIPENESCFVAHEFDSGYGIADIVLFSCNERTSFNLSSLASIPEKWAYVLRCLPYRQKFSSQELQILASASPRMTRQMLEAFVAAGYVNASNSMGQWIKIRQPRLVFYDVTAVEAKLSDWRKALNQACRYQQFAHSSWVLLDSTQGRSAIAAVASFMHFNVGLATIDANAHVKIIYKPVHDEPKSPVLHWMANVSLAKIVLAKDRCHDSGSMH